MSSRAPPGSASCATRPTRHVLFGWLQVGEVLAVGVDLAAHRTLRPWLATHPHLLAHAVPGNTVYVATDRLMLDGRDLGVAGGGAFGCFADPLRLSSGAGTRSLWRLPGWMHPSQAVRLSYHEDARRWAVADDVALLRSVAQGQEFVAAVDPARLAGWVDTLIEATDARAARPVTAINGMGRNPAARPSVDAALQHG